MTLAEELRALAKSMERNAVMLKTSDDVNEMAKQAETAEERIRYLENQLTDALRLAGDYKDAEHLLAGVVGFLKLINAREDAPRWLIEEINKNHRSVDARMYFLRSKAGKRA